MLKVLLYSLAVLGGLVAAWLLYAWAVPEPADLLPEELLISLEETGPEGVLEATAAALGAPVLHGNRIEPYENGVEIFPPMLEAIRGAERTVHFLTYVYWTGDVARAFADALSDAARRGVTVRVLLDAYGASEMADRWEEQLRGAGAEVAWFHPLSWYHLRRLNNRTHRKVLVVDGRIGFTGGVGIAEEWEGDARGPSEWRDDHFRVEGPAVRALQGAFVDNWRDATGQVLADEALYPDLPRQGEATVVPLITSPRGDVSPIALLYWIALNVARTRVDIVTPYFLPDDAVVEAMVDAAERGVSVRLLVPGERNDSRLVRAASLLRYEALLEGGVQLYEFQPTMLHVKAILVDDAWAVIGSANFDNRSFELNDEIVLLVADTTLVRRLEQGLRRDLERSIAVELDGVRSRSLFARLRSRLSMMLREQL